MTKLGSLFYTAISGRILASPKGHYGISENVSEGRTLGLALCLYKILSMNYLNVRENSHHWCEFCKRTMLPRLAANKM